MMQQDTPKLIPSLPVGRLRSVQARLLVLFGLTSATIVAAMKLIGSYGVPMISLHPDAAAALAMGLTAIVAVTIFAIIVERTVTRPVCSLAQTAREVAGGNLAARAPVTTVDEVGALAAVFNHMVEQFQLSQEALLRQERLAAVGQLTATVSHELRNPLGTIRTSFYVLAQRLRGRVPEVAPILDRIEQSIVRCDAIIGDLLDYSRLRMLERHSTDLDAWLQVLLSEHQIPEQIALVRDLDCGVRLEIDRERLRRCILNVVTNACQAMDSRGGRLSVSSRCEGRRAVVRVSDTGCGIPTAQLPRVFEPLYTTKNCGIGLGLPVVRQIVRQHGGEVELSSQVGEGTTVALWLPLPDSAA